jgi:hypothetical protein
MGFTCTGQGVCVDDQKLLPPAIALKQEAVAYVEQHVGHLVSVPRTVYCSSATCANSYGFTGQDAYTVGVKSRLFIDAFNEQRRFFLLPRFESLDG